jgi:hypothetical protein
MIALMKPTGIETNAAHIAATSIALLRSVPSTTNHPMTRITPQTSDTLPAFVSLVGAGFLGG